MMKAMRCLVLGMAVSALLSCGTLGKTGGSGWGLSVQERRDRFIDKGFEPAYSARDNNDIDAYIELHGAPESISKEPIVNRHDRIVDEMVTLRYPGYEMRYLSYSPRELWHPPKSLLMAVLSRAGGHYLFGMEPGMERRKAEEILGFAESGKPSVHIGSRNGYRATLSFESGRLAGIIWDYSGD